MLVWVHPEYLWLLLLLLPFGAWLLFGQHRRRLVWRALALRGRAPRDGSLHVLAAALCLVVALAQPRWGGLFGSTLPPGHDVVLVVDVSRSMGAQDAVPNRLAVAVEGAESLIRALAREQATRAALVAFAGRGVPRCPLTENLGAVRDALHRLRPGGVQPGGTDLGAALDAAIEALGAEEHAEGRSAVIFSDGEDHPGTWAKRLDRLRDKGVVVHAVSIGDSDSGHPVPTDEPAPAPLRYHGEPVMSQRNDGALEAITRATGGAIVKLGVASADLGSLYESRIEPAARRNREWSPRAERPERFPLFLAGALALVLGAFWPPGRGWRFLGIISYPWSWPSLRLRGRKRRRASLGDTRAVVLCGLGLAIALGASDATPPTKSDDSAAARFTRGQTAYAENSFDMALAAFSLVIADEPNLPVARYNAAAALFQLGRFAEARQRYLEARERADRWLRIKIDYALGNTLLSSRDVPGAIEAYDRCLASSGGGADLDAVRNDAAINRLYALAQAQSLAVPPSTTTGDDSQQGRRNPNRRGAGDEPSPEGPSQGDSGGDGSDAGTGEGQNRPRNNLRRFGGAGGSRSSAAGTRGNTPEDRLDAAIDEIRAAQSRRLPDEPTRDSQNDDHKDW
jgi:Ca-activated chloride channel homolog